MSVGGAHGDHLGIISRCADSCVAIRVHAVVAAGIAGRYYYHDSSLPGLLHRLAQRIKRVALQDSPAQRKIDDANVVDALELNGPVYGSDDSAVCPASIRIQHAQIDDVGVCRHTLNESPGAGSIAGDQSGYVRAMPILIGRVHSRNETLAVHHTRGPGDGVHQVRGVCTNTAVDDRNANPAAVIPKLLS